MRRSVILISVILTLCIALGVWMDVSQQRVAREYLDSVRLIRDLAVLGALLAQNPPQAVIPDLPVQAV